MVRTLGFALSKIKVVFSIRELQVHANLLNNIRVFTDIIFYNDSINKSIMLGFKDNLKVNVLPPKNSDLSKQKEIYHRKVKYTVIRKGNS